MAYIGECGYSLMCIYKTYRDYLTESAYETYKMKFFHD